MFSNAPRVNFLHPSHYWLILIRYINIPTWQLMTMNSKRVSTLSNDEDVQFLGQRGESGGQEPVREEYQEVEADRDLPF